LARFVEIGIRRSSAAILFGEIARPSFQKLVRYCGNPFPLNFDPAPWVVFHTLSPDDVPKTTSDGTSSTRTNLSLGDELDYETGERRQAER
jgi:hypothetical protein